MASIETLPTDQRAVLELVLRQGRSYDEIAELLNIDRAGVRERALAAFDALGPQTRLPVERRALIADYLLGALPDRVAAEVRDHLAQSAAERAWARVIASELQGISSSPLPEIPGDAPAKKAQPAAAAAPTPAPSPRAQPPAAAAGATPAATAAAAEETTPPSGPSGSPPSSRVGGWVLLAGGAAVVVAVILVIVLTSGGGGSKKQPLASKPSATTPAAGTSSTSTTSTTSTRAQILAQINLKPPAGGSSPVGIAEVLRQAGKEGIAIVAQGLSPNTKKPADAYAVWLYNAPSDAKILGFVNPAVGSNGKLQTAGGLPTNAGHFQKLLITLETQSNPKTPGKIVLEGALTGV